MAGCLFGSFGVLHVCDRRGEDHTRWPLFVCCGVAGTIVIIETTETAITRLASLRVGSSGTRRKAVDEVCRYRGRGGWMFVSFRVLCFVDMRGGDYTKRLTLCCCGAMGNNSEQL